MRLKIVIGIVLLMVLLAGCAPGPNTMKDQPSKENKVAGFWTGLWL